MTVKYARIILSKYKIKPNKSEINLLCLLDNWFPGKFVYNEGQLVIHNKIPDFIRIDKHKVLLELIGREDFSNHSKSELMKREKLFESLGYRTLFIYQKELKNEEELFNTIISFVHNIKDINGV